MDKRNASSVREQGENLRAVMAKLARLNLWYGMLHNTQGKYSCQRFVVRKTSIRKKSVAIIQCVPLAGSPGKCWFTKGTKVQYICMSYL
jgi:hypothetical protein